MAPLDPDLLLRAYTIGVFPMAESRTASDVYWVEPKRRGVLTLEAFHLSRSLAKTLRADRFAVTCDQAFAEVVSATPPPVRSGKQPKILFATQPGVEPPKFVLFTSGPLEASYQRFLERRLREHFGFDGTPIDLVIKARLPRSKRS